MGTGQTLLTLGALAIFSTIALSLNLEIFESGKVLVDSQIVNSAAAVGRNHIEMAKQFSFDEAVIADPELEDANALTLSANFGAEAGEVFADFDDVDDLHNYLDSVTTDLTQFYVTSRLVYVDSTDFNGQLAAQSFIKRMNVLVYTPFMEDTLRMVHYFSHWK